MHHIALFRCCYFVVLISTITTACINNNLPLTASEALTPEIMSQISAAEAQIRRRLPIGSRTSIKRIVEELQRQVRIVD